MQRGHRTYLSLFEASPTVEPSTAPGRKGRSEELIQQRNSLLFHRYYYYSRIKKIDYHRVLATLEAELFISERRIVDITQGADKYILKELYAQHYPEPNMLYFKEKFPFMNWQ
jgi:hypothetical protein